MVTKVLRILYVDDSPDDRALVSEVVATLLVPVDLTAAPGLEEAKGYAAKVEAGDLPVPGVILLDYNLDGHTGTEVLAAFSSYKTLSGVPAAMFTGSDNPTDIASCYQAGAACYFKKPGSPARISKILETLWRCLSTVPVCYDALKLLPEYRPFPSTAPTRPRSVARKRRST